MAPTVELLPPEMDEKLVQWLQDEDIVAERAQRGQDAATLVVVREAACPLTQSQVERLVRPS